MKDRSPILDDLSAVAMGAMGAVKALGEEASTFRRSRADARAADHDLATREEVDVLKDMLRGALARIDALEAEVAGLKAKKMG